MSTYARRVATFGTTVFTEINALAQQYNALNLGQGKPDFDTPPDIVAHLAQAAQAGLYNQYAPGSGTASLRQAIVDHSARFYGMDIDARRASWLRRVPPKASSPPFWGWLIPAMK